MLNILARPVNKRRKALKKIFILAAAVLCLTFSSCKDENDVNVAEEIIADDIETVSETTALSENETAASETEAIADTEVSEDTEQTTLTGTVLSETATDSKTETLSQPKYETYGDRLGEIKSFNLSVFYPVEDGQSAEYSFCSVSLVNSERIYRLDAGGSNVANTAAYLTDNQLKTILDSILGMSVMPYDEASSDKGGYELKAENSAGDTVNSRVVGEPPAEITKLLEELTELAGSDFDQSKFNEMIASIPNGISNGVVPVYACLHSNLDRYEVRGGDRAVYEGKEMTFKSRDEVNAAADLLDDEDVMPIAENWDGYAFVKFGEDGQIEYVNWSETESGLSEKPLTYDDCMAYYIEDGTVIAFSDYRNQNG